MEKTISHDKLYTEQKNKYEILFVSVLHSFLLQM